MDLLFQQKITVNENYDVIVVGGGPSGCAAAIAAAREGAKTLLIEATNALGGMATMGAVPAWCPFSDKEKIIYRGIAQKIFTASKEGSAHIGPDAVDWVPIDPEKLKVILDDFVTQSGADILFGTTLSAVQANNGITEYIVVTNKDGLCGYRAKVFVDCTGDGDLCAMSGAEFFKGDEQTGDMQMATLCFAAANVDMYGYIFGQRLHGSDCKSPIHEIVRSGKFPHITDTHLCQNIIGPGVVGFNAGHVEGLDGTDAQSLTKGYIKGRKIAADILSALKEYVPQSFANAFLVSTSGLMGVRETRRILGDYVLTADDYAACRTFEDEIGRCCYYIDIHRKTGEGQKYPPYGAGQSYGIPYRCLTPKGLKNVVTAGRIISCDRQILGSVRVMPPAMVTGEAAGLAAALCAHSGNIDVHQLDVPILRQKLLQNGAYFS